MEQVYSKEHTFSTALRSSSFLHLWFVWTFCFSSLAQPGDVFFWAAGGMSGYKQMQSNVRHTSGEEGVLQRSAPWIVAGQRFEVCNLLEMMLVFIAINSIGTSGSPKANMEPTKMEI